MSGFNMNQVALSGNLTRDPELRALPSGTSVCSLRVAFNERVKDGQSGEWVDRANYINVTVWGGIGEWVANNLGKGDTIIVGGRLRWHEWQAKDGTNRQDIDIIADTVIPRNSGGGGGGGGYHRDDSAGGGFTPRSDVTPEPEPVSTGGGGFQPRAADNTPIDDDIPF